MAALLDYLNGLKTDAQEGLGRVPGPVMVSAGLALANGGNGIDAIGGYARGMAAHQQGQLAAQEQQMALEEHGLKLQKLDQEIAGLELDNAGQKALNEGRRRISAVLKQNPGLTPEEAVRAAVIESGHEDWVDRWVDAEDRTAKREDLQKYREQMVGVAEQNAQTGFINAGANAVRVDSEAQAKAAERERERALTEQKLDQQSATAGAAFEEGTRRIDELLAHPGFDQIYGPKGSAAEAVGERVANTVGSIAAPERNDANALRDAIQSDAVLQEFQQQKAAGVTFAAATEGEWRLLAKAANDAANPNQSPAQARQKWGEYKEHRAKLYTLMQEDYRRQKEIIGGGGAGGQGAQGGKVVTRGWLEQQARSRGISTEEAVQKARAAGYEVQ